MLARLCAVANYGSPKQNRKDKKITVRTVPSVAIFAREQEHRIENKWDALMHCDLKIESNDDDDDDDKQQWQAH